MDLPANLTATRLSVTTSGTANTVTTGILVASSVSGQRYRLWGFIAYPTSTAQAAVNWRATATVGVGGVPFVGLSGNNFATPGMALIPGGVLNLTFASIGYSIQSALASLVLDLIAYTTIEAAA